MFRDEIDFWGQVSTRTHVLLVQMSQIRPSKAPELLRQVSSHTMYSLNGFGKSTPPQNR